MHVTAGTYAQNQPLEFTQQDSGMATAPITYLADPGSTVRLTGGREVGSWKTLAEMDVRKQLPEVARSHVVVEDLRAQGILDFGTLAVRGLALARLRVIFANESLAPEPGTQNSNLAPNGR